MKKMALNPLLLMLILLRRLLLANKQHSHQQYRVPFPSALSRHLHKPHPPPWWLLPLPKPFTVAASLLLLWLLCDLHHLQQLWQAEEPITCRPLLQEAQEHMTVHQQHSGLFQAQTVSVLGLAHLLEAAVRMICQGALFHQMDGHQQPFASTPTGTAVVVGTAA